MTDSTRKGSLRSSHPRPGPQNGWDQTQTPVPPPPVPAPQLPSITPHKVREVYKINLCKRIRARKVLWKGDQVGRAKDDIDRAWNHVAKQMGMTVQEVKKDFSSVKKSLQTRIERAIKNGSGRTSSWEEIDKIVNDQFKNRCLPKLWSELPWLATEIASQILNKGKKRRGRPSEPTQQLSRSNEGCVGGPSEIGVTEEEGGSNSKPGKRKAGNGKNLAKKKPDNQLPVTSSMPEQSSALNDDPLPGLNTLAIGVKEECADEDIETEEERNWRRMGPPVDLDFSQSAGGAGTASASVPAGGYSTFSAAPLDGYTTSTLQQPPQQFPNQDQVNLMYNPNPGNFSIQGGGCFPGRSGVSELTDYTISMLESQFYYRLGMVDSEIANHVHVLARKVMFMPGPARRRPHNGTQI